MVDYEWNEANSLVLIKLYKEREILWNPKNSKYFKKPLKQIAWEEVGRIMGTNGANCKNKMITLLSSFRREKGKIKRYEEIGKDVPYTSPWFAFQALSFLNERERHKAGVEVTHHANEGNRPAVVQDQIGDSSVSQPGSSTRKGPAEAKYETQEVSGNLAPAFDPFNSSTDIPIQEDEIKRFCTFLACKMIKYPERTKNAVQHAIYDILRKADTGYLETQNYKKVSFSSPK